MLGGRSRGPAATWLSEEFEIEKYSGVSSHSDCNRVFSMSAQAAAWDCAASLHVTIERHLGQSAFCGGQPGESGASVRASLTASFSG